MDSADSGNGREGAEQGGPHRGLAARAARWSAQHRKTAIWGWLAFVVVAFMIGNAVGQNEIHGADQFTGEAGRAEQTL